MQDNYCISPILQLLNPDNTISANRFLSHAIGMNETIIFSALISKFTYYSRKYPESVVDGWFFSTVPDLQESTTFGEKAQKRAIDKLIELGLISVKKQGIPQRRYFKISNDLELLEGLIAEGEAIAKNIKALASEKNKQKAERAKERRLAEETFCSNETGEISELRINEITAPKTDETSEFNSDKLAVLKTDETSEFNSDELAVLKPTNWRSNLKEVKPNINNLNINQSSVTKSAANDGSKSKSENKKSKTDRLTDIHTNKKTINEIICDIGYKGAYMNGEVFENKDGLTEITITLMKECNIPSEYHKDKISLRNALNIFVQWNYAHNSFKEQKDKELYNHIVETIFSLLTTQTTHFKDRNISYVQAFECVNNKIHTHGTLYSWIVMAMKEWKSIISRINIKNVTAYMKMCIWNWLESSELEVKDIADNYAKQTNSTNNYRPYYYNRSKDLYAEAASRPQSYDLEEYERLAVNFVDYYSEEDK